VCGWNLESEWRNVRIVGPVDEVGGGGGEDIRRMRGVEV